MSRIVWVLPTGLPLAVLATALWLVAAEPKITGLMRETNGEILLSSQAEAGSYYRIDTSPDLEQWSPLVTVLATGSDQLVDTAAPYLDRRFYRAVALTGRRILTGDHLSTSEGDAVLHPVGHASVVVSWNGKMLYSDPSGADELFAGLAPADVVVITHAHGDHFSASRLSAQLNADGVIFAPQAVYDRMPSALRSVTTVLANGETGGAQGMIIRAVPMYNLSNSNHPQGIGNGYVVTLGGTNVYFSGDTEDTPEMRALTGIDAAFVCMSLPSNMTVDAAASAVREFKPRMVFPYHYRQATTFDTVRFKRLVGTDLGIEVRLRDFY